MTPEAETYRLLFSCPNGRQFAGVFRRDVGEQHFDAASCKPSRSEGPLAYYLIPALELTVVENTSTDGWSCYEWRSRADARDFRRRSIEHTLGAWVLKVPHEAGTYATLNVERIPSEPRTLKMTTLGLKDVTRGFVGAGKVTEWCGWWWSVPYAEPPVPVAEGE